MRHLTALLALVLATGAPAADFGCARVRAVDGRAYGAVTFRPFEAGRRALIPLFVFVDSGDHRQPWLRARRVAEALPRAVERMLAGDELRIGTGSAGHPAVFVGPLEIAAVHPGDARRFRNETGELRPLSPRAIATYWKLLLDDLVTVFVRFPMERDMAVASRLHLAETRSGVLLKRMLVETEVLLRYEELSLAAATAQQVQAKTLEVLDALTPEQWSALANLAFRVPPELAGDDGEAAASTPPEAVQLYHEPDRTVWPGAGERPPTARELQGK